MIQLVVPLYRNVGGIPEQPNNRTTRPRTYRFDALFEVSIHHEFLRQWLILFPSLYGVTLAQTILYYRRFPDDARRLKFLVGACFLICPTQRLFNTHLRSSLFRTFFVPCACLLSVTIVGSVLDTFHIYSVCGVVWYTTVIGEHCVLLVRCAHIEWMLPRASLPTLFIHSDVLVGLHIILLRVHWLI